MINGYVYLLAEMGDNFRYKIGFSKDPDKRIKPLRTGNSDEIMELYRYQSYNYIAVERMLHIKFKPDRKHLEWFTMTDEQVLSFMEEAKKADENIDFLNNNNHFFEL